MNTVWRRSSTELDAQADRAITEAIVLGDTYADKVGARMDYEAERAVEKDAAIRRIMAAKDLAATPAEKLVETDEHYAAFLRAYRNSVVEEKKAESRSKCAQIRARLAVARVEGLVAK